MNIETKQWIGDKKIKEAVELKDKTPMGAPMIEVTYVDNKKEILSKLMFDATVSEKSCDLTTLRMKRMSPVVAAVLSIMREWGIKVGETPIFSELITRSLNYNKDQAEMKLWKKWNPTIKSNEDVNMLMVDLVLKSVEEEGGIPTPYLNEPPQETGN